MLTTASLVAKPTAVSKWYSLSVLSKTDSFVSVKLTTANLRIIMSKVQGHLVSLTVTALVVCRHQKNI